jgi:glycosyltransferase involved in cell wall biosynthesis
MVRYKVAVVIPALNEAKTIGSLIEAIREVGTAIVVDDGSIDETKKVASNSGAIVVTHDVNLGYDAALNSGFLVASEMGFDVIVTVDADGQHDVSLINLFISKLELGSELVIGVRNKKQRVAEYFFGVYTSWRYGVKDPLCGMKAYRMSLYNSLGHFDTYNSIGTELMLYALANHYSFEQVNILVGNRVGVSRFGSCLAGNYKIIRAMIYGVFKIKKGIS